MRATSGLLCPLRPACKDQDGARSTAPSCSRRRQCHSAELACARPRANPARKFITENVLNLQFTPFRATYHAPLAKKGNTMAKYENTSKFLGIVPQRLAFAALAGVASFGLAGVGEAA